MVLCLLTVSASEDIIHEGDEIEISDDINIIDDEVSDTIVAQVDSQDDNTNISDENDDSVQGDVLVEESEETISVKQQATELQYTPPTHFQITAHIQTNLHTGYSYFLPEDSLPTSFAHLPFLECGAVGSTTESLPLVSGVFRHVPHTIIPKRDELDVVLENLDQVIEAEVGEETKLGGLDMLDADGVGNETDSANGGVEDIPKRPSPPKYVVALSPLEITVGGNCNETQNFKAGDLIFIEETWWGVWDNEEEREDASSPESTQAENDQSKMKGYIMKASSQTETDLNVLMLTVPDSVHRHWKNAQYAMLMAKREEKESKQQQKQSTLSANTEVGIRRPWWKPTSAFLPKHNSILQQQEVLPKPCSLESDPAFAHPSAMSSPTLSQHFTNHFTNLIRQSTNPHPSFLPHHHQDLLLPILAQTAAAIVGGATSLALVLQLWRIIPGPVAVGFGSVVLIGLGTWRIVWLGEEILDQIELWRERRRLERMMSEGWGN